MPAAMPKSEEVRLRSWERTCCGHVWCQGSASDEGKEKRGREEERREMH